MINNNKEDLLKDAVYLTLSKDEIEQRLRNDFSKQLSADDIQIEVSKPISTILKNENTIISILFLIIVILTVITIYIW